MLKKAKGMNSQTLKSVPEEHATSLPSQPGCVKSGPNLFLCPRHEHRLSGLPYCNTWVFPNDDILAHLSSWWCLGESLQERSDPAWLGEPPEQQLQEPQDLWLSRCGRVQSQMARLLVACVFTAFPVLTEIVPPLWWSCWYAGSTPPHPTGPSTDRSFLFPFLLKAPKGSLGFDHKQTFLTWLLLLL